MSSQARNGLAGFQFPSGNKRGNTGPPCQVAQMWGRRGEERLSFKSCQHSNIKNWSPTPLFSKLGNVFLQVKTNSKCYLLYVPGNAACGILVPWPEIKLVSPTVEAQIANHWTSKEVHQCFNLTRQKSWSELLWKLTFHMYNKILRSFDALESMSVFQNSWPSLYRIFLKG